MKPKPGEIDERVEALAQRVTLQARACINQMVDSGDYGIRDASYLVAMRLLVFSLSGVQVARRMDKKRSEEMLVDLIRQLEQESARRN